jgi:DNA modification methylase
MADSNLIHGKALAELAKLPGASIDLCLTDPPFEKTNSPWDKLIPIEPMPLFGE